MLAFIKNIIAFLTLKNKTLFWKVEYGFERTEDNGQRTVMEDFPPVPYGKSLINKSLKENLTYKKAFVFAIEIVNLYKYLIDEKMEYIISKQVLRSGISIGANVKEGLEAQSRRDFLKQTNNLRQSR